VGTFVEWQRTGVLELKPRFQRRDVWKAKEKSLLIDTVARGMPMPIILLRQRQDLDTLTMHLEVVDGQQRLRTLFSYIKPGLLTDLKPERDLFAVSRSHNAELGGREFDTLSIDMKRQLLEYEISTHVFPPSTEDEIILRIFARLNSTGSRLNPQEIRNSEWYGEFKTTSFEVGFRNLENWDRWGVFSDDELARMAEAEAVSEYLLAMMFGVAAKSKTKLDKAYRDYDIVFLGQVELERRLQVVLDAVGDAVGDMLAETKLSRSALFYSLFTACYDHMFGLESPHDEKKKSRGLPRAFRASLIRLSTKIATGALPDDVQDAMDKGTSDKKRRLIRHKYFMEELGLASRR